MAWNLDSDRPIYTQIVEKIQMQIVSGFYHPGDKLPSVRELALDLAINPNTIQKSYAELIRRGVIIPSPGSGTYVAPEAKARIREAAAEKLSRLEELVADLAMADMPKGDVLATVCAVYARAGKGNAPEKPDPTQEGGKQS